MKKLILVSNRLPVKVTGSKDNITFTSTDGGLATAVGKVSRRLQARWVGYLGDALDPETVASARQHRYYPVVIPPTTYQHYYSQFSNRVLWPVLHGFAPFGSPRSHWSDYVRANQAFADEVARLARPGDTIWVHDYHLFLLPELLRARGLKNKIGFFLHTPFPDHSFFADTPAGRRILRSLAMADSLGVQTQGYLQRLNGALARMGAQVGQASRLVRTPGRIIRTGAFPIGIDFRYFSRRLEPVAGFLEQLRPKEGSKIILSLSRLDYTKGIPELLEAVAGMVRNPDNPRRFVLRLVVIPSREVQPEYRQLRSRIEQGVKSINDLASETGWQPVEYHYGTLSPDQLLAAYRQADVFVAPSRADGMNLVAKEYLAANAKGTLVLSREAGAAEQLSEALLVDSADPADIARALTRALAVPVPRQTIRRLRRIVRTENVFAWADNFLKTL